MASSSPRKWKYDLIFSFSGKDASQDFLRDLDSRLTENGVITFKVDNKLQSGEEIGAAFLEAIESSMIALVMVSEEYASSKWCLDELLKILEGRKNRGQEVIPLLYRVVSSDLENPTTGAFASAFAGHEKNFKEEVETWKDAMTQLVDLWVYPLEDWRCHLWFTYCCYDFSHRLDEIKSKQVDLIKNVVLGTREHVVATESGIEEMKNLSSKASSSSTRKWTYDLIFSFSGKDAPQDFLRDLDSSLTANGIITFKVDNELRSGEEIGAAFLEAIESSMIALVILSKEYVSSKWCLDELLKILEGRKNRGQEVIPLLYRVVTSDLENPTTGAFAKAFAGHQKNCKEEVETWKGAMTQLVGLKVFRLENPSRSDYADKSDVDCSKDAVLGTKKHVMKRESGIEEMKNLLTEASSSSTRKWKYDVFFSFRGPDTRHGFLSLLHPSFDANGIKCYKDDIHLKIGQEIEPAIMEAVEASMIALIIISKDYATSKYCLDELWKAMECKEKNGQIVIPIFYHVNPSDVRRPTSGSFAKAFTDHQRDFEDKEGSWKDAMTQVAHISGWNLTSDEYWAEREYTDRIMDDILDKLKALCSNLEGKLKC